MVDVGNSLAFDVGEHIPGLRMMVYIRFGDRVVPAQITGPRPMIDKTAQFRWFLVSSELAHNVSPSGIQLFFVAHKARIMKLKDR